MRMMHIVTLSTGIALAVSPCMAGDFTRNWSYDLPGSGGYGEEAIAFGNIDGECPDEIVVADGPTISVLSASGSNVWTYTNPWGEYVERIVLRDLDGDGFDEIVAAGTDLGLMAVDHNGSLLWRYAPPSSPATTIWGMELGNPDYDDDPEVVFAYGQYLIVRNARTGSQEQSYTPGTGHDLRCVALGNLDGSGPDEVVFGHTLSGSYERVESRNMLTGATQYYNAPDRVTVIRVADLNSDGVPEVVAGTYGTSPSSGWVMVLSNTLALCWQASLGARVRDITLADVNGDGTKDVIVAAGATVRTLNGVSGAVLWSFATMGDAFNVRVGDFYGSGGLTIAVSSMGRRLYVLNTAGQQLWQDTVTGSADYDIAIAGRGTRFACADSQNAYLYENPTAPTYSVSGTIRDMFGAALANVAVTVGEVTDSTDATGLYSVSGLTVGSYTAVAGKTDYGFRPRSVTVTVGPNRSGVDFTGHQAWPMYRKDARHSGAASCTVPSNNSLAWRTSLGSGITGGPIVSRGAVYVGAGNTLYAVDETTGQILRSFAAGAGIFASPAILGDYLVLGSEGTLYCLNPDNFSVRWSAAVQSKYSAPTIADGCVFIGSTLTGSQKLYCYDLYTGTKRWEYAAGASVHSSPIVLGGYVYFTTYASDGLLVCLNESDGSFVCSYATTGQMESSPSVDPTDTWILCGDNAQTLYCLNRSTFGLRWTADVDGSIRSCPAVINDRVFVGSTDPAFHCRYLSNGDLVWRVVPAGYAARSAPAVTSSRVLFGDRGGIFSCYDHSGNLIWNYTAGGPVESSPAVVNGRVYVGSDDGYLCCFGPAVNQAPKDIALSNGAVAENQPSGTAVGTLSTTDPDTGNTFVYALTNGTGSTDNNSFTISGSNLLTAALFDYEVKNSYSIRLQSTDQGGLSTQKVFTITVNDVNETPTNITLSCSTIPENQPVGTTVGAFRTQDPDLTSTFSYTLVAGTGSGDNDSFAISGSNLLTAASFNSEVQSNYSIRVQSADQGGLFTQKVFTITVSNVNETPTNIVLSNASVAENQASNTTVGAFSTQDPDTTSTFSYTLVAGTGSTDNGSFTISGSNLLTTTSFNYEVKSNYSIRVQSADQGGLSMQKVFAITVTDIVEPPPVLQQPDIAPDGSAVIRWSSMTNHTYTVHHATNLLTGFSALQTGIPATPAVNSYTDTVNGVQQKFWKVSTEP